MSCPECGGFDTPQGLGTALKPATEIVVVARKPLAGTVAANVLTHGTGALNVDGCRVGDGGQLSWAEPRGIGYMGGGSDAGTVAATESAKGRWPANVVLDEHAAAELDRQSGTLASGILAAHHQRAPKDAGILGAYGSAEGERGYGDTGGASRFFPTFRYEAKAPSSERPRYNKSVLRLRAGLTPEQVGHVRARLAEAGVQVD